MVRWGVAGASTAGNAVRECKGRHLLQLGGHMHLCAERLTHQRIVRQSRPLEIDILDAGYAAQASLPIP